MRCVLGLVTLLPVTAGFLLFSGCEEVDYIYVSEPPPSLYGCWEAYTPEAVGLDELTLALHSDGTYTFFARVGYFESYEEGEWEYDGYREVCFYSDYINGHREHTVWEAKVWPIEHDELKVRFLDSECECPVYFERSCR